MLIAARFAVAQQPPTIDDAALQEGRQHWRRMDQLQRQLVRTAMCPSAQIDASNVSRLHLAWYSDIPAATGNPQSRQERRLLVYNGVLYSIAWSVVYALDARTGKEL